MAKKTATTTKTKTSTKENDTKVKFTITDESSMSAPAEESNFPHGFESSPTTLDRTKTVHTAEDLERFGTDKEKRNVDSDINALLGILVNRIKNEQNIEFIENLTSENYDKLFTAFKNALYLSEILLSKPTNSDTPVGNTIPRMHGYVEYESERWENDTVEVSVKVYPRLSLTTDFDSDSTYVLRYTPSIVRTVVMKNNRKAEPEVRIMVPGEVVVKFSTLDSKIKYSVNSNGITEEFGNIFDIFKHVTYLEEKMNRLNCITCQKRCKIPDCCFLYEDRLFARKRNGRGEEMTINLTAKIKNGSIKVSKKVINFLRVNEFVKEDILCFVQTRLCN